MAIGNTNCINCRNRTVTCHGECKSYLDYVERNERLKERRRLENEYFVYAGESIRERNCREARKRH